MEKEQLSEENKKLRERYTEEELAILEEMDQEFIDGLNEGMK